LALLRRRRRVSDPAAEADHTSTASIANPQPEGRLQ
jgi:hypothetical protein